MAVSKRLRYEVLRRDNHTCKYCGGTAPDVTLTVDHVVPSTLGGSDDPSNLVAACKDCNAGKSASNPDAPLVADVDEKAAQWAQAMNRVVNDRMAEHAAQRTRVAVFDQKWCSWRDGAGDELPREGNWKNSIVMFLANGLDDEFLADAVDTAAGNRKIRYTDVWRYFCGICWRELDAIRERTAGAVGAGHEDKDEEDGGGFPVFDMVCEYVGLVVRALGGDERVEKFVDKTIGNTLSDTNKHWDAKFVGCDDGMEKVVEHLRAHAEPDMKQIMEWRRVNRPGPTEQLDAMNLADTFLGKVLEAFAVAAEDRSTVHNAYWSAMQHAHETFVENKPPSGTDLREWAALDMEIEAETGLGQVGQRRAQQVSVALAGYYVQRVLELVGASPGDVEEARSGTPLVLENGVTEFGEACKRHHGITDRDALAAAHVVMDEWIATDVAPRMNQREVSR